MMVQNDNKKMKLIARSVIDGDWNNGADDKDRDGVMIIPKISNLVINPLEKFSLIEEKWNCNG